MHTRIAITVLILRPVSHSVWCEAMSDPSSASAPSDGKTSELLEGWKTQVWDHVEPEFKKLAVLPVLSRADGVTGRTFALTGEATFAAFLEANKEARGVAGNLAWLDPLAVSIPNDTQTIELTEKVGRYRFWCSEKKTKSSANVATEFKHPHRFAGAEGTSCRQAPTHRNGRCGSWLSVCIREGDASGRVRE